MAFLTNDKRKWYREEYLKSDHWKDLRARKIGANPRCERCGNTPVEPHHLRYRNIFDVTLDDLMSLCRPCHKAEHSRLDAEKRRLKNKRKAKAQRKKRGETFNVVNTSVLSACGFGPVMRCRLGFGVVTTKIRDRKYAALRAILERETGRVGDRLIGAPVFDAVAARLGIRIG